MAHVLYDVVEPVQRKLEASGVLPVVSRDFQKLLRNGFGVARPRRRRHRGSGHPTEAPGQRIEQRGSQSAEQQEHFPADPKGRQAGRRQKGKHMGAVRPVFQNCCRVSKVKSLSHLSPTEIVSDRMGHEVSRNV